VRKKLFLIVIIMICALSACKQNQNISFSDQQEQWIKNHPIIKLAPDPSFAPFEFIDEKGEYSGIAADYIEYINKHSSLNIEILKLDNWNTIINEIKAKNIDMLGALSISDQRSEYLLFTEPFIDSLGVIIISDKLKENVTLEDLDNLKVAVVSQYIMSDYIETNYPNLELIKVENVDEGLKRVSFGLVDVFVENLATSSYYLKNSNVTNLRVSSRFDYDLKFRMGVRKDLPELKTILNSALSQIPKSEKQKINNKWISIDQGLYMIYWYAVYIILAFIIILIVILSWNRALKKRIQIKTEKIEDELNQRKSVEEKLKILNEQLEDKVERRTYLLNETNKELEKSMYELQLKKNEIEETNLKLEISIKDINDIQSKLIQSEKMAALGNLVAGVAHEINTPLGVAITAISHVDKMNEDILKQIDSNKLTKNNFKNYILNIEKSTIMTMKNLQYAKDLVQKFKQVAVDQQTREVRNFKIKAYIEDILISLHPEVKKYDVEIILECLDDLRIETYPGAISQIITNLIINSLKHGYIEGNHQIIKILINETKDMLVIEYSDDGKGVDRNILYKLFDPFFTTKRGSGGTGLGLNIVYNLVVDLLLGDIEAQSEGIGKGLTFIIKIPVTER